MKTAIVITSIFPPTEAVIKFAEMKDYSVILVGDKKSPESYSCPGVDYLRFNDQAGLGFKITSLLPVNHYCRKMIGYLHAIRGGFTLLLILTMITFQK